MVVFEQVFSTRLFKSTSSGASGWWGFQVPLGTTTDGQPIPLDKALTDPALTATFVYAASSPDLSSAAATNDFVNRIDAIIANRIVGTRALIFLPTGNASQITPTTGVAVALTQDTVVSTNSGATVTLTGVQGITAELAAGAVIRPTDDGDGLVFTSRSSPSVSLGGLSPGAVSQPDNSATLHFAGERQGAFSFPLSIRRGALSTDLNWGFQALVPNRGEHSGAILRLSAWLPLADGAVPSATDLIGFIAQINVVNPNNLLAASPTKLLFTGQDDGGGGGATRLASYYRTNTGKTVTLAPVVDATAGEPAALVINPGYKKTPIQNGYHFAPQGDFVMVTDDAAVNVPAYLLCGMSGSETIAFLPFVADQEPSYSLRFIANKPAYAFSFPIQPSSPIGPPIDPTALPLDSTYATSWATVIPAPNSKGRPVYTAAPEGADLFGRDPASAGDNGNLLGPVAPGVALTEPLAFPLVPFTGFQSGTGEQDIDSGQLVDLERQILGPTRRNIISQGSSATNLSPHAHVDLGVLSPDAMTCPFNATTPVGLIAHVRCDGTFDQLLLAQVCAPGSTQVTLQMGFTKLQPALQAAFQTDNLFLVVANAKCLGEPTEGSFMSPAEHTVEDENRFFDTITIADWKFRAKVGTGSQYSDYRNVMIVKGVKGKLVDLVKSPEKWTMKDLFGAPSTTRPDHTITEPDLSQLIPLSNWLADYFAVALDQATNPFFTSFCNIIQDENWTGVLVLKADIASIPKDLAGVIAGVNDPSAFFGHHIGIEISPVNGEKVQPDGSSSLFGLVYYVDPNYDDSVAAHPIPPSHLDAPYDFSVLTLKALFQNSALKRFDSLAELVLNRVFGSTVAKMGDGGNIYNAILLKGAFQKNGGAPVYSLSSSSTNSYDLANNVLTRTEIDSAVMSTRDDGSSGGPVVSWIALAGFMDLAVITDQSGTEPKQPDFDVFSFGSTSIGPRNRQGLNFDNLGLRITLVPTGGAGDGPTRVIEMVESEITFNVAASTPRDHSLYRNFQLQLLSLESGDKDRTPQSLGYLTVATPYGLQGVSDGPWHGLRCKLNLGTPGALASKVNLSSNLLLAWSDTSGSAEGSSSYQALVGIELPGTGGGGNLFSLQSVIKLSVGAVQLFYNQNAESFLLLLNEIALKIFGLLKVPPNGATAFFLFGDREAQGSTGLGWYAIYNQETAKPPPM